MHFLILITSLWSFTLGDPVEWTYDITQARVEAKNSKKVVLIVFSGSDWCKPCIQLHKDLFDSAPFQKYARENLVLVKADFPYRKKNRLSKEQTAHNEALAAQYNPNGEFPLAVFTDPSGKVLGTFNYEKTRSPEVYIEQFKQFLQ